MTTALDKDYTKNQFAKLLTKYGFRKVEIDFLGGDYYYVLAGLSIPTSHLATRREKLAYLIKQERKGRERRTRPAT